VLSVSSLFLTRVGAFVGVCVCIYTHTHTHCTDGVLGCDPRNRDETPGGFEESGWTKFRHTYVHICVHKVHMCMKNSRQKLGDTEIAERGRSVLVMRARYR